MSVLELEAMKLFEDVGLREAKSAIRRRVHGTLLWFRRPRVKGWIITQPQTLARCNASPRIA